MVLERRVGALACENNSLAAKLESRSRDVEALEGALGVRAHGTAVTSTAADVASPLLSAAVEGPPQLWLLLLSPAAAERPVQPSLIASHGHSRHARWGAHVREARRAGAGGPGGSVHQQVEAVAPPDIACRMFASAGTVHACTRPNKHASVARAPQQCSMPLSV